MSSNPSIGRSLHKACTNNDFNKIKYLVLYKSANLNWKDENGMDALMHASKNGDFLIVSFLLEKGADPKKFNKFGWNALMFASLFNYLDICTLLIFKGANLMAIGADNFSVLKNYGQWSDPPISNEEKNLKCIVLQSAFFTFQSEK
jgi:ankyrin repeat protein